MRDSRRYRALAYDVDGTLAENFRPPPRALRDLVADLDESGVVQVLVSGKPEQYLAGMARGLGLTQTSWVIGENGAVVLDWVNLVTEVKGDYQVEVEELREELWGEHLNPEEFVEEPNRAGISLFRRDRDYGGALELLSLVQRLIEKRGLPLAAEIHPDSAVVILQQGVSKGRALEEVAGWLRLTPEDFAVFGEGVNDLDLLERGYPLAPADADPSVRAVVRRRGGYLAARSGPEGVLEGFEHLRREGLCEFELPAWLEEYAPEAEPV